MPTAITARRSLTDPTWDSRATKFILLWQPVSRRPSPISPSARVFWRSGLTSRTAAIRRLQDRKDFSRIFFQARPVRAPFPSLRPPEAPPSNPPAPPPVHRSIGFPGPMDLEWRYSLHQA